ncbi:MAG: hypothetical protein ACRDFA_07535, partial [bacterium]
PSRGEEPHPARRARAGFEEREAYSPQRRTALVLAGTGTAGAYQAGVLRAFEEAGIRIDLVAGHGMGAASALFAAIAGGNALWKTGGIWTHPGRTKYRWREPLRAAGFALSAAILVLLSPMILVAGGAPVYLVAFAIGLMAPDAGRWIAAEYTALLGWLFQPAVLPSLIPRATVVALLFLVLAVGLSRLATLWGARGDRRKHGPFWWLVGPPWASRAVIQYFTTNLWSLIRRTNALAQPTAVELSRRYAELLTENLGQPGFREIVVTAHDIDARRDLVFALLAEPYRQRFFARSALQVAGQRAAEAFDLSGISRDHVVDALEGALSLPVATDPHFVTFAPESYWRGETHRLCDRPGAMTRLLEEVAAAGAEQVIVVSPITEPSSPHELNVRREDPQGRAGECLLAFGAATIRDAVVAWAGRFQGLYVIRPSHNPIGPFDAVGSYDDRSDRRHSIKELMACGYEDAYHQFIEPVVAASGEYLTQGVHDEPQYPIRRGHGADPSERRRSQ